MRVFARSIGAALVIAVVVGCQGSGDSANAVTPPVATPSITVSLSVTSLNLSQGQSGTVTATIARNNGYAGSVDLSLEGAPTGVAGTFSPATVPSGATTSSLALTVSSNVAASSYSLTVRGRGQGVTDNTATLTLAVTPAGDFSLTVTPTTVVLPQGASVTATVAVVRVGGFADAVALSVSGAPAGVTAVAAPASVTDNSASITVTAATTAAPGTFTLTVHGTANGLGERTAALAVQITQVTGTTVTMQYCDALPSWIGAQSDAGAWTQLTPVGPNTYTFSVGTRGAIAVAVQVEGGYETSITYASSSELVAAGASTVAYCANPPWGAKRLTGTVANIPQSSIASVMLGNAYADISGMSTSSSFSLVGAPDQVSDLLAIRQPMVSGNLAVDRLIIRRGLNLPSGATIPLLDFASGESFAPLINTATILGLGGDSAEVSSQFVTATRTATSLSWSEGTTSQPFSSVPSGQLAAGDIHQLAVVAVSALGDNSLRGVGGFFHLLGDRTLALGPTLTIPTITTVSSVAPQRIRIQLPSQGEYASFSGDIYLQDDGTTYRDVELFMTAGYLGGTPVTWDLTVPDLSGAGYNAVWGLRTGIPVVWAATATNVVAISSDLAPDGSIMVLAARAGSSSALASMRARTNGLSLQRLLSARRRRPAARSQR